MAKTFWSCVLLLLVFSMPAFARAGADPTQVLVVGTIHENHRSNPNYTYDHLLQILASFKPDVICVEIRPEDFRKVPYLEEMMIATTYGLKRGLKVYPIDWSSDANPRLEREEFVKTAEYAAKSAREKQMAVDSQIWSRFKARHGEDMQRQAREEGYEFFNGADYNDFIAEMYRISMAVYGDSSMNLYYETRNKKMTQLISKAAAENPGKRIIVLTGAEHKHYFDRSLASLDGVQVVRFGTVLPLEPVALDPEIVALIKDGRSALYFDLSTPEGLDNYYQGALVSLTHGPGMDVYPERIPAGNIEKSKSIIAEWGARAPSSPRYRLELAWNRFLTGATTDAIHIVETVIPHVDRIEPARMRPLVYRLLGMCYDITGQREKALAAYGAGEEAASELNLPEKLRTILFSEVKAKPYPGLPTTR